MTARVTAGLARSSGLPGLDLRRPRPCDRAYAERLYVGSMKPLLTQLDAWDEADVRARFQLYYKPDEVEIMSIDGADAGWLQIAETEDEIDLVQIHLEEDHRCRGLGSRLMAELLTRARARGKPVSLEVIRNNRAIALYQRLGFKVVGEDETKLYMRWEG